MLIDADVQLFSPGPIAHKVTAHVLPIPIYEIQTFSIYHSNTHLANELCIL